MRKAVTALALIALAAVVAGLAVAAVIGPDPVKTGTANAQNPAASADWFAWTQSPSAHPNRTVVRAESMPVDGTDDFRVNPVGTRAWTGGVDGNVLVYQEIDSGDSDIRLHDLAADMPLPDQDVNTRSWEWHPTVSTDSNGDMWILFGRQSLRTGAQRVIAYNVDQAQKRVLQGTERRRYSLIPGQVTGDWATWTSCMPNCNVRYVNLIDGSAVVKIPRPSGVKHQYASSVTEDGTVYFAASASGCGASVEIDRYEAGVREVLVDLPRRRDVFFMYATTDVDGNHVFFDRVNCVTGAWNIYKLLDAPDGP